jgi:hypothetical protein
MPSKRSKDETRATTSKLPSDVLPGVDELKRRLEEICARPKATYDDASRASEAAQLIGDLLRLEERALRLIRGEADPAGGGEASRSPGDLSGLTLDEAARRVLRDRQRPMHARDLGEEIKARGWRHPRSRVARPDQIVYQLAARLGKNPGFVRTAPNTFALRGHGDVEPPTPPQPRVGIIDTPHQEPSARWLSEHPEEWYDDMVPDDRG